MQKKLPALWELFTTWLLMGIQSFGGGSSTFLLIHQTCIGRCWLNEEEFTRAWALAQIAPGINLVKLTAMIGYRLRGWSGLLAAMSGLLLPSGLVTVLMTAGFSNIRSQPLVQAAMKGILPATIGLMLAMGIKMAQPLLHRAYQEGWARLSTHLTVLTGAALLLGVSNISPITVLLLAGFVTALLLAIVPIDKQRNAKVEI